MSYNGWSNYATWAVNLWMTESGDYWDEVAQEAWNDAVATNGFSQSEMAHMSFAARAQSEHEDSNPLDEASMWADLLSHALQQVAWSEIAEHRLSDLVEE